MRTWHHYAGAIMLSFLLFVVLGGVGWNSYVSCERHALREAYQREIETQREREERRLEELMADCEDSERRLPSGFGDPGPLSLELMCDHLMHEATVIHTDVGVTVLRCTCNPEKLR